VEAARNLERAGRLDAAMEAYSRLKQWSSAALLARRLGHAENAACFFAEAGEPFEAAGCFREVRDANRELEQLIRVPPAHPHYREACVRVIGLASDRATLTFELEHFLNKFVVAGPATDDEFDAYYRLALLFENHEFPENAAACYRKILATRPFFRDAQDRLKAAQTDYRGAAAKDYERAFKEELAFREAVKRNEAPLVAQPTEDDDDPLDPLPELPELPDLPALPAAAAPSGEAGSRGSAPVAVAHAHTLLSPAGRTPPPVAVPPVAPAAAVPTLVEPELTWGIATQIGFSGVTLEPGAVVNQRYRLEKKIGHPPRHQTGQLLHHRRGRAQGHGFRHRQAPQRWPRADPRGHDGRHAPVHSSRASEQLQRRHPSGGPLRFGLYRLPDVRRYGPLRRRRGHADSDRPHVSRA
jgi:hypothetical protein